MAGVVDTTHVFATDQVITSTLMNNIIDETFFTSDALANGTLSLTANKMKVATGGITATEIATGAVTTTAIGAAAVTTAKILDLNVTTGKIADANVTTAKIADGAVTLPKITVPPNFPVQIISATKSDVQQITSSANIFQDITGLSLTLTRTFPDAFGKVLIQAQVNTDTASSGHGVGIRILRDGVPIGVGNAEGIRTSVTSHGSHGGARGAFPISISFLDESPGSAATVTYKVQAVDTSTSATRLYINNNNEDSNNTYTFRSISTLTLTELAP